MSNKESSLPSAETGVPEGVSARPSEAAPVARETPTYLPAVSEEEATGPRFVRRTTGTRTLAYVPSPEEFLVRRQADEPTRPMHRHTSPMVPVVTVARSVVSATVTVSRPSQEPPHTQLVPSAAPAPLVRTQGAPLAPAVTPDGYAAVPPPPPRLEVTTHRLEAQVDPRLVLLAQPHSAQAASFRALRQRVAERGDPRSILVTSAKDGEGRTTCAANLALALAEVRRYRVLLLEADLRRPAMAGLFGLPPSTSFLDQIAPPRSEAEAVFQVAELEGRGLHVAVIDPKREHTTLDGPLFRAAVERLRRAYDYVVIDAPSVLEGPDVNLIEDSAEAIVLAARAKRSRGRQLRSAIEQITPSNLLGVVLLEG